MPERNTLVFSESPVVEFASNLFAGVPVILQADEMPLIEMVRSEDAGFTTQIAIFHKDGTYLAKVKGTQMYLTSEGEKAGLTLRHPGVMTVCELGDETLFEVRRNAAAALKVTAELYTPTGGFIKGYDYLKYIESFGPGGIAIGLSDGMRLGLKDLIVTCDNPDGIGICVHREGWVRFGINCKVRQEWKGEPSDPSLAHMWLQMQGNGPDNSFSDCKFGRDEILKKYAT